MAKEWIPNLNIGQDYDKAYRNADIHFDRLGTMADFFGRDMPVHLHADFCQIHVVLAGHTYFSIDQNRYTTDGAAIFFTPAATPHAFLTETHAPGYVLTLHQSIVQNMIQALGLMQQNSFFVMPHAVSIQNLIPEKIALFKSTLALIDIIKAEWLSQQTYKNDAIAELIKVLLLNIFRLSAPDEKATRNSRHVVEIYKNFTQLVEENFKEKKGIGFYCQQLNINESRLNYVCKKVSGAPPKTVISNRVILEAKRHMIHANQNLNELSFELGYLDPSYFSRFFQLKTGLTPSKYKKLNSQG
jgi:AraC family 4-hydroxyphenylacetate 3-monooxygenase operon regulatory protein